MKANMKSAKAARYKKEWLYDCLLLKIKSTAVYTFLHENNFLPLPHPRTLYSYLKNLKAGFGFDENLFDILKDKVEKIPKRERRGVLMFDEMSVRKSLHVRESDMALLGKVDLAEHTKPTDQVKDGDHVLVFLFRPFLGGWSQTVGAFCTSGAAPGSTVAKLILQCIVLLSNAGVIVEAVTCDNSTSNRSALNSLGVSGDVTRVSTSFEHPCDSSKVIQAIIDPPHIFKCIRNNLLKAGKFLLPGDKEVQHSHFEALLDYEEQQAGLRAVPKLTKAHISPNAFQKLSVRLAVQLFSESTASAMDFYRSREECVKLRGSKATSDFARRMNSLFDCFNSKRPQDVQYNEAEHISTLKENIEWLDRPSQVKWPLLVATCNKKSGNYQKALATYRSLHRRFPENVECLRLLVRLTNDLGLSESEDYAAKLKKAEKAKEMKEQGALHQSSSSGAMSEDKEVKPVHGLFAVPALPAFDFDRTSEWPSWIELFDDYRFASGLNERSEEVQVRTILYTMGRQNLDQQTSTDVTQAWGKLKRNALYEACKLKELYHVQSKPLPIPGTE
ncbi:hypothetical protein MRX96_007174 [Rhipicephalus microplus]